jgi:hypothetical protein
MRIAILNYEKPWFVLASTSLTKGLQKSFDDCEIVYFVEEESVPLIKYNKNLSVISGYTVNGDFDCVINFSPTMQAANFCESISAKEKYGFIEKDGQVCCIDKNSAEFYDVMHNQLKTSKCLFQLIFRLANQTWKGEGYNLSYYPKNKTIKTNTGVAIVDDDLRAYVKNNLSLSMSQVYYLPNKNNLYKKLDEINRCMNIVTDDLFVLHAGICLRKNVEFLDTKNLNYKIEFFGKGNHYRIVDGKWSNKTEQDRCEENTQIN